MPIKTIEIVCVPCDKCAKLERDVRLLIKNIESDYKVKFPYEFKHTTTLMNIDRYGVNASQAPVLLVNDKVELAGRVDFLTLKKKMELLHKGV